MVRATEGWDRTKEFIAMGRAGGSKLGGSQPVAVARAPLDEAKCGVMLAGSNHGLSIGLVIPGATIRSGL